MIAPKIFRSQPELVQQAIRNKGATVRYLGYATSFRREASAAGKDMGRALVAILENFQTEDRSVNVPRQLRGWIGRRTRPG